jgi:hypothetical protein
MTPTRVHEAVPRVVAEVAVYSPLRSRSSNDLALRLAVPAIYQYRNFAAAGGSMRLWQRDG